LKWLSLKHAAPVQGRAAGRHRLGVQAPPVRVLEVTHTFPRSQLASRCLERRERLEHRSAVRAREGPAVRSPLSGRARPQGAPIHLLVARRLALRYIGAAALCPDAQTPPHGRPCSPPTSLRPVVASCGCGPNANQVALPSPSPDPTIARRPVHGTDRAPARWEQQPPRPRLPGRRCATHRPPLPTNPVPK
jgi:hypothetical protein